jgi:hypothetical protein
MANAGGNAPRRDERYEEEWSDAASGSGVTRGRGRGRPPGRSNTTRGRGGSVRASSNRFDVLRDESTPRRLSSESMDVAQPKTPDNTTVPVSTSAQENWSSQGIAGAKRTVEERSPGAEENPRNVRPRMNEFDMGVVFGEIEETMSNSMKEVVMKAPEEVREGMKAGFDVVMKAVHKMMNALSDGVGHERIQRETLEMSLVDRIEKLEAKREDMQATLDSLTEHRVKTRTRDSIKEMEKVVDESQCCLKLLNVNVGKETSDRREIVRRTIEEVRYFVKEGDLRYLDSVLRRTKIVIMGRSTQRWEDGDEFCYSVPTLFQCRDRRDVDELEGILRAAGYFPSYHWPREMMEFVEGVRSEVRKEGFGQDSHYVRVRPEKRDGKVMVKAEVKRKEGVDRFVIKGLWACPPFDRYLWDDVPDMFRSKLTSRAGSG